MEDSISIVLDTGAGSWNAVAWLVALAVAGLVAWFVRSFGRSDFKAEGDKDQPFISGNEAPDNAQLHIGGSNLYWGFTEALQGYYKRLIPLHTGDVSDYVLWFLGSTALALVFVLTL